MGEKINKTIGKNNRNHSPTLIFKNTQITDPKDVANAFKEKMANTINEEQDTIFDKNHKLYIME